MLLILYVSQYTPEWVLGWKKFAAQKIIEKYLQIHPGDFESIAHLFLEDF